MPPEPDNITDLLVSYGRGDKESLDKLMPVVYDELRRQAARYLRREQPGHTLQTTALIHEAYVRLVDQRNVQWQNRAHFFGIAAQMMRRILTDHARRRAAVRHGGGMRLVVPEDLAAQPDGDILAVDEALTELKELDEELARIVELRFFGGLQQDEMAAVLGLSTATVNRRFRIAKAWLYRRLSGRG